MKELASRFLRRKNAVVGLIILSFVAVFALGANVLYPDSPFALAGKPLQPPSSDYLLGTDTLGRDLAASMVHGAKASLLIALSATSAAVFIGILVGGAAGYLGGTTDNLLMRFTEVFQTIPAFLFVIVLVAILGPTLSNVILAISAVTWPGVARLVRAEFLSMRHREFVQACVAAGLSDMRIVALHILPNAASSIIVTASLMTASAILTESALSFLGLSDPNIMTWGLLIGAGRTALRTAWWVCAIPGIAILLTVLAINLVGDGLNDAFNPRLRQK